MVKRRKSLAGLFATCAVFLTAGTANANTANPDVFNEGDIHGTSTSTCVDGSRLSLNIEYEMSTTDLDRLSSETGIDRNDLKRNLSRQVMRTADAAVDEYLSDYNLATILQRMGHAQQRNIFLSEAFHNVVNKIENETGLTIRINTNTSYLSGRPGC